jgi:hypothetical protein
MKKFINLMGLSVVMNFAFAEVSLAANDFFRCDRTFASDQGLVKRGDPNTLNKMYPLELKIVIAENRSWAATYYGVHSNRGKSFRKNDIIVTKSGFQIYGKQLRTTGEIMITFNQAGKKTGRPARYQCDKPKKTRWEPDD